MCGITGYIDLNSSIEKRYIFKMLSSIKHRGPDDTGTYFDKHIALGIQRLSIIDLKGGHQPISNENRDIWVVFNGEIYNYIELRKKLIKKHTFATNTDTEVLVHLYEEHGEDFVRYLNGMFAFALWDKKKQQLILGRDFVGVKPLYFYQKGSRLVFGSELKTILKFPGIKRSINTKALELYSFLGYIPQPHSIFENIYKLPAGEILIFSKAGLRTKKFWDITNVTADKENSLDNLLKNSVKLQSRSDVPVGVFLSGGIDSTLMTYYLSQTVNRQVKTFSISFSEKSFDESKYFNQVGSLLNTEHYSTNFNVDDVLNLFPKITQQLDEPLADPSLFPTFKVSALASRYAKVVLSGDGGDELFAGYPTYSAHTAANLLKFIPPAVFEPLIRMLKKTPISYNNFPLTERLILFLSDFSLPLVNRHFLWMSIDKTRRSISNFNFENNEWLNSLSIELSKMSVDSKVKPQIIDFLTYLIDDLLVKVDRASMYNSLEVRVPFLDPQIVNFAFSKNRKHYSFFETKTMLRKLLKDKFPNFIVNRGKKGFGIPISAWIQDPLKDLVGDYLNNPDLYNYFNKKEVLGSFKMHVNKKANFGRRLWMLVIFSSWLENWK